MLNITYIFSRGRKNLISNNLDFAKDFFYGFFYFQSQGHNLEIIEFENNNSFLIYFDKFMNKFLKLPFSTHQITRLKNIKILNKTDHLFLVNDNVACSSIFLLIYLKLFSKTKVTFFVMGLYSKKVKNAFVQKIHFLVIKFLIIFIDNLVFLGEGEYEIAKKIHKKNNNLFFIPFCVDTEFWKVEKEYNPSNQEYILFIGNDGNRDYILLKNLIKQCKQFKFKVVSQNSEIKNLKLKNLEVLKGKWDEYILSDKNIRELYINSKFVIIPLKESYQPSGQSVALQAMSCKIPVVISLTKGFWDKKNFINYENIIFIEEDNLVTWKSKITSLYKENYILKNVSNKSIETINKNYDIKNFNKQIEEIMLLS